jgi:hypothetical protein
MNGNDLTYIGSDCFYIMFCKGTHEVRRIINSNDDYEVVFKGKYEDCIIHLMLENVSYQESLY